MMEGILNIDKPTSLTSHDVVNRVRRLAGLRRVGHTGTLDPLATGVLVVCLGRATRLAEYVEGLPKTYETVVRLGQETNTYDAEGVVVAERPCTATVEQVQAALAPFHGRIQQLPPRYSAIKKGGQPLYKLARQGIDVVVEPRQVHIYQLTLLDYAPPLLTLAVTCSRGTYIRSLAHDLGQALGCGGHVAKLRRTAVGPFGQQTAVPLADLTPERLAAHVQPADTAVAHLPRIVVDADDAQRLQNGVAIAQTSPVTAPIATAYSADGYFWGMLAADGEQWRPHKIFLPATAAQEVQSDEQNG